MFRSIFIVPFIYTWYGPICYYCYMAVFITFSYVMNCHIGTYPKWFLLHVCIVVYTKYYCIHMEVICFYNPFFKSPKPWRVLETTFFFFLSFFFCLLPICPFSSPYNLIKSLYPVPLSFAYVLFYFWKE